MDFKKYLLVLSPDEQICEINKAINYLNKSNRKKISIKFKMLKELRLCDVFFVVFIKYCQ